MSRSFQDVIAHYPAHVQTLAFQARELIRRLIPAAEETVDESVAVLSFGFGAGYAGMVCTLIVSKTGVKIGLVRGGELPDPHGLLVGSGKVHKSIQLHGLEDLRRPGVEELIVAALAAWRKRHRGV